MFADDTACADADSDLNSLISMANMELKKIALWFRTNKMVVNISKTKYIIFHNKGKTVDMDGKNVVYDDNEPLGVDPHLVVPLERYHNAHENPDCRAYKLLGIYLDEKLTFNHHTNFLCNKLNRSLFCMRRAKNFLTPTALKTLYFAFIQSHLNYCPIILSSNSQQNHYLHNYKFYLMSLSLNKQNFFLCTLLSTIMLHLLSSGFGLKTMRTKGISSYGMLTTMLYLTLEQNFSKNLLFIHYR